MSRFHSVLSQTGERLHLPKATKSLILVEIAADLEDLFQHYLERGLSEEEAAAKAEEKVDMTDEALVELVQIHSHLEELTEHRVPCLGQPRRDRPRILRRKGDGLDLVALEGCLCIGELALHPIKLVLEDARQLVQLGSLEYGRHLDVPFHDGIEDLGHLLPILARQLELNKGPLGVDVG